MFGAQEQGIIGIAGSSIAPANKTNLISSAGIQIAGVKVSISNIRVTITSDDIIRWYNPWVRDTPNKDTR